MNEFAVPYMGDENDRPAHSGLAQLTDRCDVCGSTNICCGDRAVGALCAQHCDHPFGVPKDCSKPGCGTCALHVAERLVGTHPAGSSVDGNHPDDPRRI